MSRKPIYGTNIQQEPSKTVEELRSAITHIRGQLSDIGYAYPQWKDRLVSVEGLLTCGLVSLYSSAQEMRECELKWGHKPPTDSAA